MFNTYSLSLLDAVSLDSLKTIRSGRDLLCQTQIDVYVYMCICLYCQDRQHFKVKYLSTFDRMGWLPQFLQEIIQLPKRAKHRGIFT